MPATQKTYVPAAAKTPLEPPPGEPAEPRHANVGVPAEAEPDTEVQEVPAPAPKGAEKQMNWEKNNRKEMLFCSCGRPALRDATSPSNPQLTDTLPTRFLGRSLAVDGGEAVLPLAAPH